MEIGACNSFSKVGEVLLGSGPIAEAYSVDRHAICVSIDCPVAAGYWKCTRLPFKSTLSDLVLILLIFHDSGD